MSCRCRDISDCQYDITVISEISSNLRSIKSTQDNVNDEYTELANISRQAFITNNMSQLNEAQCKLNETVVEEVPKLINKCSEKIRHLHRELSSMRSEDQDYHDHEDDD